MLRVFLKQEKNPTFSFFFFLAERLQTLIPLPILGSVCRKQINLKKALNILLSSSPSPEYHQEGEWEEVCVQIRVVPGDPEHGSSGGGTDRGRPRNARLWGGAQRSQGRGKLWEGEIPVLC